MSLTLSSFKPELHYINYPDEVKKLENYRLRPGTCSMAGFLAENESLANVCLKDSEFLKSKQITHEQIADCLETIIIKAQSLLFSNYHGSSSLMDLTKRVAIIGNKIQVPYYCPTLGHQACPFSKDLSNPATWCGKSTSEITIINSATKKSFMVTELHPHLIRDHHFFQGNTPYRLDPALAIEVLDITPDRSYHLQKTNTWEGIDFEGEFIKETLHAARKNKIDCLKTKEFEAYELPYKDFSVYDDSPANKADNNFAKIWQDSLAKNENPSSEEIQEKDDGSYLHVFTFEKLADKNKTYFIGQSILNGVDIRPPNEHTVYKQISSTTVNLEEGDFLSYQP